ncbi:hypothetical protein RJ640_012048 [Escallonia rubra]|uniref:AN1-type domain-containing protein n=1 Tax=Escallonia rubra TaxID=112253 RepID=A0AA88R2B4_9ASTE|nr:hypothetical protein RJ640_012048 [Escallonia rubra]
MASTSDISVLVDGEVILLPDLISTLDHVDKLDHNWLLIASTQNVSNFPFQLDANGKHWLRGFFLGEADLQLGGVVDRVERQKTLAQWRARLDSAGFGSIHLGSNAFKQASMLLALFAGGDGYRIISKRQADKSGMAEANLEKPTAITTTVVNMITPYTSPFPWANAMLSPTTKVDAVSKLPLKSRCQCCNKKVGVTGFECRCGAMFCGVHRQIEARDCSFDFKALGRLILLKENPVCKGDKLETRV